MPRLIPTAAIVTAAGNLPKHIEEYAGRVSSGHTAVSVARMVSPAGWIEPGQRPEFQEITVVLRGHLRVEHRDGTLEARAGQAIVAEPGEWVRYSTPEEGGAEYVAVCLPAFSPATVHRDDEGAGAAAPPPSPEIYPMPAFPTLVVRDLEASARWYREVLGFRHIFTIPGPGAGPVLVHLRWTRYGDLLLRRPMGPPDERPKGVGISLSFAVFEGRVDDVAERARRAGATLETEPKDQPWNARDFSIRDPDGFLLTFTQGPVEKNLTMDRIVQRSMGAERA